MTVEELLQSMTYANSAEREEAEKYISLKGIVQYQRIIEFCKIQEQDSLPTYAKISSLYKYDKRLRNTLYIYIATVEEYLRAIIGNKFEADETGLIKTTKFLNKQKKYKSISLTLERLTFGELQEVIIKNISLFKDKYNLDVFEQQLNTFRVLRNKVSHHNFLLAESYDKCDSREGYGRTLRDNIFNLQSLLPVDFQKGLATSINNCAKGLFLVESAISI